MQVTHIESKGKSVHNVFLAKSSQEKEGKAKGKGKHATTMRKEEDRPTCSHFQKKGHEEATCWKLHLGMNTNNDKKDSKNNKILAMDSSK